MSLRIIILAAGQGTRMRSALPKVLHPLAGRPMLAHVIGAAHAVEAGAVHVVYGHGGEQVPAALPDLGVDWVEQAEQLGTGHAVARTADHLQPGETAVVLYGDVPLIQPQTLQRLIAAAGNEHLALLTVDLADPTGYGRIVRGADGSVQSIVEHKDATAAQHEITEVNTGILAVDGGRLREWLARLENDNAQGEYYLTDVVAMAVADGVAVVAEQPADVSEVMGVNDRAQLAFLERVYQRAEAARLMAAGVTLADPERIDVRGVLETGQDISVDINVIFTGKVTLANDVRIGPNCTLSNVTVGAGVEILANSVIDDAVIGSGSRIGPFARIRPETRLADNVQVGNFVEIKKSTVATGSKINHLSYIGDSEVGKHVNIGAGTITCNYDGANKHKTIIGDNAFIGSDSQFVAPVTIGDGATVGAGSTITRDVPAGELTLSRAPQETRKGWKRPQKTKK